MASAKRNRMVIGIDYGTTYTGVAYADDSTNTVKDIQLITDWPGHRRNATDEKVPSQVAYGSYPGGNKSYDWGTWGNLIPPGVNPCIWTKLRLDGEKQRSIELDAILAILSGNISRLAVGQDDDDGERPPDYPGKMPVDIVTDYLTAVKDFTFQCIEDRVGKTLFENLDLDIVITVPAVWSEKARDLTFKAVMAAGFGSTAYTSREVTNKIKMVTEPEAAAIYTLRALKEKHGSSNLKPGDHFVLCDAGGGTVDLLSYKVKTVNPDFQIEEAAVGTGDKCGSTFIDRAFRPWLKKKIGDVAYKRISDDKLQEGSKIRREFEAIKHRFDGTPMNQYVTLPRQAGLDDDPSIGLQEGDLKIGLEDLTEMFEFSVNRSLELIDGQVADIQAKGARVKAVFLVGGFGKSNYLFSKIKEYCTERGFEALRPENPWSAVARGAVARGLEADERGLVSLRLCRLHYGTPVSRKFVPGIHNPDDSYVDEHTGERMARGQMSWMVSKGHPLPTNAPKRVSIDCSTKFDENESRTFSARLVSANTEIAPPRYMDEASIPVCTLSADMSDVPDHKFMKARGRKGDIYYIASFSINIVIDNTRMKFSMTFDGDECGSIDAKFDG
ncbi:MAG: hypothetical protein M1814_004386 [Vezdaea aestivalis]|nr:MAG: hypothetical protein M1814_004386 [Vezdaea aestivalis]